VGIFPYVLKLLQSPIDEYKHVLVGIWAKILAFDPSCQADLVKDGALTHFVDHLHWGLTLTSASLTVGAVNVNVPPRPLLTPKPGYSSPLRRKDAADQRIMAAFILSAICHEYPAGQAECLKLKLLASVSGLLRTVEDAEDSIHSGIGIRTPPPSPHNGTGAGVVAADVNVNGNATRTEEEAHHPNDILQTILPPEFRVWLCILVHNFCHYNLTTQTEAHKILTHHNPAGLPAGPHNHNPVQHPHPHTHPSGASGNNTSLVDQLLRRQQNDESPWVRAAACFALGVLVRGYQDVAEDQSYGGVVGGVPGEGGPPALRSPAVAHGSCSSPAGMNANGNAHRLVAGGRSVYGRPGGQGNVNVTNSNPPVFSSVNTHIQSQVSGNTAANTVTNVSTTADPFRACQTS